MREIRGVLLCITQLNFIIAFSIRPDTSFGQVLYKDFIGKLSFGSVESSSENVFLGTIRKNKYALGSLMKNLTVIDAYSNRPLYRIPRPDTAINFPVFAYLKLS